MEIATNSLLIAAENAAIIFFLKFFNKSMIWNISSYALVTKKLENYVSLLAKRHLKMGGESANGNTFFVLAVIKTRKCVVNFAYFLQEHGMEYSVIFH